ncbi:cupin domain-containing protein [Microbacterium marinilacus]|nr:cupin domain-containing protein [Microbacterium marinilacus]MBY0689266.1 cupin domain-containing protein [Microbacterium marinilacus]
MRDVPLQRTHPQQSQFTVTYLLSGSWQMRVRIELDGGAHLLAEGDSAFFAGGVPHRWWTDDAPARLLVVKETVRPGHGMGPSLQDR